MKDYKRDNSVKIRNTHSSTSVHDVVKLLLVRIIRRQNPNINAVDIYTEHNGNEPNINYPDIFVGVHNFVSKKGGKSAKQHKTYVWEIQKEWSKSWEDKIIKQHENSDVCIVRLKSLQDKMKEVYNIDLSDTIEKLNKLLEEDYTFGRLY